MESKPTRWKWVLIFFLANVLVTVMLFAYGYLEFTSWHIGFFYGNKEHIEPGRLNQIREAVENLHSRVLLELSVPIVAWFVLVSSLLWDRLRNERM